MQCHVQEISTAVACDPTGSYLVAGANSGRAYWWEVCSGELLATFQVHFKAVSSMQFTRCGLFLITASLDGMIRMWDVVDVLSAAADRTVGNGVLNISPHR